MDPGPPPILTYGRGQRLTDRKAVRLALLATLAATLGLVAYWWVVPLLTNGWHLYWQHRAMTDPSPPDGTVAYDSAAPASVLPPTAAQSWARRLANAPGDVLYLGPRRSPNGKTWLVLIMLDRQSNAQTLWLRRYVIAPGTWTHPPTPVGMTGTGHPLAGVSHVIVGAAHPDPNDPAAVRLRVDLDDRHLLEEWFVDDTGPAASRTTTFRNRRNLTTRPH